MESLVKDLHATRLLLQELSKSISDQKRCINKTVDAIIQTSFRSWIQLSSWLIDTFIPAHLIKLVDLNDKSLIKIIKIK